jgi:hypothetical protein
MPADRNNQNGNGNNRKGGRNGGRNIRLDGNDCGDGRRNDILLDQNQVNENENHNGESPASTDEPGLIVSTAYMQAC